MQVLWITETCAHSMSFEMDQSKNWDSKLKILKWSVPMIWIRIETTRAVSVNYAINTSINLRLIPWRIFMTRLKILIKLLSKVQIFVIIYIFKKSSAASNETISNIDLIARRLRRILWQLFLNWSLLLLSKIKMLYFPISEVNET